MRQTLFTLLVLSLVALSAAAQENQIIWEKDYKKAQTLARETGRPLLLDFSAVWCKPCQAMDKEFWVLPEVVSAMKPFVAVKVNFDSDKSLVSKYRVAAIPFVAFTDPLGNLVTFRRGFGSKNVRELNQIFTEMPKDFSKMTPYYDAIDLKKDDSDALLKIADFYSNANMNFLSCDFYKRALKTDEVKTDEVKRERVAAAIGANYYTSQADALAIEYLDDYLKEYSTGKHREVALAMIAISNAKLDKNKESLKYLEMLKTEFPASKNIEAVNRALAESKSKAEKK